jgi:hypothetical protein
MKNRFEIYRGFKNRLDSIKFYCDTRFKTDKPAQNEILNNALHYMIGELDSITLREEISEKAQIQVIHWLENYVCKLHP